MSDQFHLQTFQIAVDREIERLRRSIRTASRDSTISTAGRDSTITNTGLNAQQVTIILKLIQESKSIDDPEIIEILEQLRASDEEMRLQDELYRLEQQQLLLEELLALDPQDELFDDRMQHPVQISTSSIKDVRNDRDQLSQVKSEELMKRPDIRALLCPALQTASDDALEIAKIATPILVGLVIAGTLTIPLIPTLFASIALTISRLGIASLCADLNKSKD